MNVLLISPLPNVDPACGDVVYTETLLACPPDGVIYVTYAQALANGTLIEHGTRRSLNLALATRRGMVRELFLMGVIHAVNYLRRHRWLFWEPFRFFSVKQGEYDLIHVHVFSVRFFGSHCPVVLSNAAPLRDLYTVARGYSASRVRLLETVEIALSRALGINATSYYLPRTDRVIAFTRFLRDWYIARGIISTSKIEIVPINLPSRDAVPSKARPTKVGFIAKDFDAKGGDTLLNAFRIVRSVQPEAELVIVGCAPRLTSYEAAELGITWIPYVPRDQLLQKILPSFDVFAYPTRFDGLPLVVLEAISLGIPVAISDYQSMPEIVDDGRAGLLSPVGDADALARNILRLLEPDTNAIYGAAAYERFETCYSTSAVLPRLKECYEASVRSARGSES